MHIYSKNFSNNNKRNLTIPPNKHTTAMVTVTYCYCQFVFHRPPAVAVLSGWRLLNVVLRAPSSVPVVLL